MEDYVTLTAAGARSEAVNLQILGITSEKPPNAKMPKAFNPAAQKLWEEALVSPEYRTVNVKGSTTLAKWDALIGIFLSDCRAAKVYPFNSPASELANTKFASSLDNARKAVASFFNTHKLANLFVIKSVDKTYAFNAGNTVLKVKASAKSINDPTLPKLLADIGFVPRTDLGKSSWSFSPQANVEIIITEVSKAKTILEYVLSVHPAMVYTSKTDTRLPSKKKLGEFFESKFLRPVLKKYPIKNLSKPF